MASETNERRVIITILLVSTLLTMLGVAGLIMGVSDLSLAPIPEDARDYYEEETELTDIQVEMIEVWASNPYRRPMAAANVVVSTLVLIGSFLLSWRRRLAQWWIRQAVTAKVLWIVAYTASLGHHIHRRSPCCRGVPRDASRHWSVHRRERQAASLEADSAHDRARKRSNHCHDEPPGGGRVHDGCASVDRAQHLTSYAFGLPSEGRRLKPRGHARLHEAGLHGNDTQAVRAVRRHR
jgi:hypothetical protein